MASVVASLNSVQPHPASYDETSESRPARTVDAERCITAFPVGFGGWTAAKMYEQGINGRRHSDNTAAVATRQQVSLKQESCAIAKMTAQCALYMGALKFSGTP